MNYTQLIEKALKQGLTDIEIYDEKNSELEFTVFEGKIDKNVMSRTHGLAVRGMYEGKMGYVSVENTSDESMDFIIKALIDNASLMSNVQSDQIFVGSKQYTALEPVNTSVLKVSPKDKINMMLELEGKIKSIDPRVSQVDYCLYQEQVVETSLHNSKGLDLNKIEVTIIIYVSVVASEGDSVKSHGDYMIVNHLDDIDLDTFSQKIVKTATSMLHASPVQSNKYPVIIENKVFADLLEAFTPMFSGESAVKDITLLKDKLNNKIIGDNITLVSDPLFKSSYAQSAFDDEGVACKRTEVVTQGVLNTLLHNLKTAKQLNTEATGNGFKRNVKSPVGVVPYNFYLEPGDIDPNTMVEAVDNGLLITHLQGLHSGVNPITGDFSLQASGFLITNKKMDRPVNLIVLSGNILDLLSSIESIGNDLKFNLNRVGAPSVKVTSLSISGN